MDPPEHWQIFTKNQQDVLTAVLALCNEKEAEHGVLAAEASEMRQRSNHLDKVTVCLLTQEMMNVMKISRLEMTLQQLEKVSYDGILNIEIPNYSQKKATAMTGNPSFYSDDFYTDHHGYKMCARIYLNGTGEGKGTHLSVFLAIKKGRYDNYLSWPFQRHVTFTLLNQAGKDHLNYTFRPDPASSSFQKPTEELNIASGCPMFVAHKVIENPGEGFLRNDMISLQVKVDPPTKV